MHIAEIEPVAWSARYECDTSALPPSNVRAGRHTFTVATTQDRQVFDITARVRDAVAQTGIEDGIAVVNCLHTTCSVLVQPADSAVLSALLAGMDSMIPADAMYRHNDPRFSDCERGNGAAHLRAALFGHGVMVSLEAGRLRLEESLLLVEWDGPRCRSIDVHVLGA